MQSDLQPDLAIHFRDRTLYVDVAFVCTTAPGYASKDWKQSMVERERQKHDKYDPLVDRHGVIMHQVFRFSAFVVSVHGEMGEEAEDVLKQLAAEAVEQGHDESSFLQYAERRVAYGIAHGNALVATAFTRQLAVQRGRLFGGSGDEDVAVDTGMGLGGGPIGGGGGGVVSAVCRR